jgi:hypothetical protein
VVGIRSRRLSLVALTVSAIGLVAAAGALGGTQKHAKATSFRAVFHVKWQGHPCGMLKPPGSVACDSTAGTGVFSSLANAKENYDLYVLAPSKECSQWLFTSVVSVPHRGTVNIAVKSDPCVDPTALNAKGTFVIGGGTGYYAGATGQGTWAGKDGKVTGKNKGTATDVFTGSISLAD